MPYHELFAGLMVLLYTHGDPAIESELVLNPKVGEDVRWNKRRSLDDPLTANERVVYAFYRNARSYLWTKYLAGADVKDYAFLMQVFINAAEKHLRLRIARGELSMVSFKRRAPLLNREFVEIFDQEYQETIEAGR
jgi:hypothetical protein